MGTAVYALLGLHCMIGLYPTGYLRFKLRYLDANSSVSSIVEMILK